MQIGEAKSALIDSREETVRRYDLDLDREAPFLDTVKLYEDQMFHFILGLLI
ncbi:MAG: hypothetical protein ACC608_06285 [Anaerofustis sp.]